MVFWERLGSCPDCAFERRLWGSSLAQVLCTAADAIAGPQATAPEPSRKAPFDLMVANLDKPDQGVGPGHTVGRVTW